MIRDRSEKRLYRKSPGRQYGYEYDPLHSQSLSGNSSVHSDSWGAHEQTSSRSSSGRRTSGPLAPRPNPRRTRQLLRQSIIASKSKAAVLEDTGVLDPELSDRYASAGEYPEMYEREVDTTLYSNRHHRFTSTRLAPPVQEPYQERYVEEDEDLDAGEGPWADEEPAYDYMDPDLGYDEEEDPLAYRLAYTESPRVKSTSLRPQSTALERGRSRSVPLEYEADEYEDEQDQAPAKHKEKKKKGGLSRRKLLIGAVAVGGTAVAAYELVPRLPQALQEAGTNIEHQLQDAFNKGLAAGEDAVRKEFINSLDTLEGVSLEGAIGAARLTRVAYDVFVSPLVTLAATVADDFLSVTLAALIKARSWLAQINADNATLSALQNVLQNWVNQAHNMPKKLQTITETDLDGAQAYLRALQRKIQQEQAKLNGQATTPTPTAKH